MRNAASDLLLFAPPPRHNGTRTSRAAAEAVDPKRASTCRDRILAYLGRVYWGATAEETARDLEIRLDTAKARIHELGQLGLVVALKLEKPRTTSTGHEALAFTSADNQHGRHIEPWPLPRIDWKAKHDAMERRAIDAERRVEELEQRLARTNQPQESEA